MRLVAAVWLAVFLAACATITKGTTQVVAVNTPGVNGASCTLTSPAIGSLTVVTPDTISLPKASTTYPFTAPSNATRTALG